MSQVLLVGSSASRFLAESGDGVGFSPRRSPAAPVLSRGWCLLSPIVIFSSKTGMSCPGWGPYPSQPLDGIAALAFGDDAVSPGLLDGVQAAIGDRDQLVGARGCAACE